MRIGSSLFFIALGAILVWAIHAELPNVSLNVIGYILMAVGAVGLVWSLFATRRSRVVETRTLSDPATGEKVTRSEASEGL